MFGGLPGSRAQQPGNVTRNIKTLLGEAASLTTTVANANAASALNFPGVSGSGSTTTGTISSGSNTLTLAAPLDFKNGQGIRINNAGAAFAVGAPTGASATPVGTPGSTTYTYTISVLDANGGVGAAIATFSTSTGNATLSATNYNSLTWSVGSGGVPIGFAVYGRTAGSLVLLAVVGATTFFDYGSTVWVTPTPPDFLPSTPPASSLADWLVTSILSGGGTASLTLATAATTSVTSGAVLHDDTVALQGAITSVGTSLVPLFLPAGTYRISSALSSTTGSLQLYGAGAQNTTIMLSSLSQDGLDVSSVFGFRSFRNFRMIGQGGVYGTTGAFLSTSGGAGDTFEYLSFAHGFNGIVTSSPNMQIARCVIAVSANAIKTTSVGDSTITRNDINTVVTPGASAGLGVSCLGDPGGMRIINNKFNAGGPGYLVAIDVVAQASDGDFVVCGNSIEGWTSAGIQMDRSSSFIFGNVVIVGNQMAGTGRGIYFSNATASVYSNVTIHGNVISATVENINMGAVNGFAIGGNVFNGATNPAIRVTANAAGGTLQGNAYNGPAATITDASSSCVYKTDTSTAPAHP